MHGQRRQNQQQFNQEISVGRAHAPCKPAYGASLYDFWRRRALFRARSRIRVSDGKPFPSRRKAVIREGVYATTVEVDGYIYNSVTNIGSKPTFNDYSLTIESFLVNYKGNLYDKYITVYFTAKSAILKIQFGMGSSRSDRKRPGSRENDKQELMIKFGPSGNSESFYNEGHKSTVEAPKWVKERGLDIYEYSFGKGVLMGENTAKLIGAEAQKYGVEITAHAPYFINFANPDDEKGEKTGLITFWTA